MLRLLYEKVKIMKKLALVCLLSLSSVGLKTMDHNNKNSPLKNSSQGKNGQSRPTTASTAAASANPTASASSTGSDSSFSGFRRGFLSPKNSRK